MYKKTINYTDFEGNKVSDDFYFNLTQAELTELNFNLDGGFEKFGKKFKENPNEGRILEVFKKLIHKAVCEKSADGRRVIKNDDISDSFIASDAYSQLFIELVFSKDDSKITDFLSKVVVGLPTEARKELENGGKVTSINRQPTIVDDVDGTVTEVK